MFTGIINHLGRFKKYFPGKQEICVEALSTADKLAIGDSLAVNGVCLSLIQKEKNLLWFHISEETLKKTTLSSLAIGERLNLELPISLSQPLGGHLVTGHIDGMGKVSHIQSSRQGKRFSLSFPRDLKPYFIPKGSVALDGVSLTIAELHPSDFEVEVIPITLQNTNISGWKRGKAVNIECDIIGKYVYNWTSKR